MLLVQSKQEVQYMSTYNYNTMHAQLVYLTNYVCIINTSIRICKSYIVWLCKHHKKCHSKRSLHAN